MAAIPEKRRLRVAVIGTGALGRHHARLLAALPEAQLVGVYDIRPEVAAEVAAEHATESFSNISALADEVDAAVVAVPTYAHAQIARPLLEKGLHVLVEKPMTATLDEADELIAAAGDRVLAVGHVEFFNPAVQALLARREPARFVEVQRLSPFTPRSLDIDVILDLMIHDLQILHALDPSPVHEIRATGIDVLSPKVDIANARVELESGLVANVTASRVSAETIRKLRVFLRSRYLSVDYRRQEIKGFGLKEEGERRVILPHRVAVRRGEPLRAEVEAFVDVCLGGEAAYVDGRQGRQALETALAVSAAIG